MSKHRLNFNASKNRHNQASEHILKQAQNDRTDYIVECILFYEEYKSIQAIISNTIRSVLSSYQPSNIEKPNPKKIESLSEIPSDVLDIEW